MAQECRRIIVGREAEVGGVYEYESAATGCCVDQSMGRERAVGKEERRFKETFLVSLAFVLGTAGIKGLVYRHVEGYRELS